MATQNIAQGPIDSGFLSQLISADLEVLAVKAKEVVDFEGGSGTCIAPHIRRTKTFVHILADTAKEDNALFLGAFQNAHTDETKVPSGDGQLCEKILSCFSAMCTVILLASAAQAYIFGGGSKALFREVPQRQGGQDGERAAIAPQAPIALLNLKSSLDELQRELQDDNIAQLDNAGLRLCRSIGFCNQWAAQMRMFCKGALEQLFKLTARNLHDLAEGLDSAIPRWGALFPAGQGIDIGLVTAKILNHPKRSSVPMTVRHIKKMLAELDKVSATMGTGVKLDASMHAVVTSTLTTAENFLLICAGSHTICNAGSAGYAKNAQDILDIAARTSSFDMPDSLRKALQEATLGKAVVASPSAIAVKRPPCASDASDAGVSEKRAKVERASGSKEPACETEDGTSSGASAAGSATGGTAQGGAARQVGGASKLAPKAPSARRGLRALRQPRAPTT